MSRGTISSGSDGGVCPMHLLITPDYQEGGGDKQVATTAPSWRGKEGLLPRVYLNLHETSMVIRDLAKILPEGRARTFLRKWFIPSAFCICSCMKVGGKGPSGDYSSWYDIDDEVVSYMKGEIEEWKQSLGGAPSFVYYLDPTPEVSLAERSFTLIRGVELQYREWRREESNWNNPPLDNIGILLNRMSTYLFWLCRSEARRQGVSESYSPRTMPSLPEGLGMSKH